MWKVFQGSIVVGFCSPTSISSGALALAKGACDAGTLSLKYFTPHGQALAELRKLLIETENILHDRPRDFQRWNSTPG
jgi:hypothetical protein